MDKKAIAERILKTGGNLYVVFNPRLGAMVPPQFRNERSITFEYGYNMPQPIPDLELRRDGIYATLAFGKRQLETFVSWQSIQALRNEDYSEGYVWGTQAEIPTQPRLQLIQGGRK